MKTQRIRGGIVVAGASISLAVLMFLPRFLSFGIGLGVVLLLTITVGYLDFAGALRLTPRQARPATPPVDLAGAPMWLCLLAGFDIRLFYVGLSFIAAGACRLSVIGSLAAAAPWSGPLFMGIGLAAIALARVRRRPFDGDFHEGLLVFGLATATIMATLGSQGLWDCWETHYGEVARRQLEQDDWITLFWENEWFFSKPILIFWMMNLGMALFGVTIGPDQIPDHVEWGVRFFVGALAIAVIMSLYTLLARRVSKRAGLFVALVLGTMPLFSFMARQAITDLPFVGFMTLGVVLFLLGITAPPDAEVRTVALPLSKGRSLELSGFHAVMAGYILVAVPQFLYLATRSSLFLWGTLGRDDLRSVASKVKPIGLNLSDYVSSLFGFRLGGRQDISLDWLLLGLAFGLPFAALLVTLVKERRVERLCYHGMYLMLALSLMAKGLAGFVLPLLGLIGLWMVIAPIRDLAHPRRFLAWHYDKARRLDLLRGVPLMLLTASPWYAAMIFRHGDAFFNRFFIHDHLKRLSVGVHGETGTFQYFVQQLGYAAFPWVALLPFALLAWPRLVPKEASADRRIRLYATCWALLSFVLLSMMVTKFHHYVFPLLPPAAILIGLFLEDLWLKRVPRLAPIVLVGVVILAVVGSDLSAEPKKAEGVLEGYARLVGLFIYKYSRSYPEGAAFDFSRPLIAFTVLFAALLAAWLLKPRRLLIVLTIAAALVFNHWVSQHYMVQLAPHWTQKHLFAEYYAKRSSPAERVVAFQMNWKGENFYTGNRVVVYVSTKNKQFEEWADKHRGERHFFITEQSRFDNLSRRTKAASGPLTPLSDTCNKYKIGVAEKL